MDNYWIWWILAAVLIGAEMLTGTFYLLAVGIAFALGGVVAWVGASLPMQLLTAGVLSVVGTVIANRWRRARGDPPPSPGSTSARACTSNRGKPTASARVVYRGTKWNGVLASSETPRRHTMYIVATRGSTLVLGAERP